MPLVTLRGPAVARGGRCPWQSATKPPDRQSSARQAGPAAHLYRRQSLGVRVSGSDAAVCDDDCQPCVGPWSGLRTGAYQPSRSLRSWLFGDADNCTTYDSWPYGLQKRVGYSKRLTDDQLKQQLASRPATYLLGGLDILPLFGFDGSCGAMAQGPTRMARGLAYARVR